jgi:hypothetical protein
METTRTWASLPAGSALGCMTDPTGTDPSDLEFIQLLSAYRSTGGLARRQGWDATTPDSSAARPHPSPLFGFPWGGDYWMPRFQWLDGMDQVNPSCVAVQAELAEVFTGIEIARWYVSPNAFLGHAAPLQVLTRSPELVVQAARMDRFIALG